MRQSTLTVEIGEVLGDLTEKLRLYDQYYSITGSITENLQLVEDVSSRKGFCINFEGLRDLRSMSAPHKGETFLEKHGFKNSQLDDYLDQYHADVARTARFFKDPLSLRGLNAPGLSRFFPSQIR